MMTEKAYAFRFTLWLFVLRVAGLYPIPVEQHPSASNWQFLTNVLATVWTILFTISKFLYFVTSASPIQSLSFKDIPGIVDSVSKFQAGIWTVIIPVNFLYYSRSIVRCVYSYRDLADHHSSKRQKRMIIVLQYALLLLLIVYIVDFYVVSESDEVSSPYPITDRIIIKMSGLTGNNARLLISVLDGLVKIHVVLSYMIMIFFCSIFLDILSLYKSLNRELGDALSLSSDFYGEQKKLNQIVTDVDKCTRMQTLFFVTEIVLWVMNIINHIPRQQSLQQMTAHSIVYLIIFLTIFLCLQVAISEQGKRFPSFLSDLAEKQKDPDRRLLYFIQSHNAKSYPAFSLAGIMPIDRIGLLSLLGLIATYALVVIQFGDKKECGTEIELATNIQSLLDEIRQHNTTCCPIHET